MKKVKILLENFEEWTFNSEDVYILAEGLCLTLSEGRWRWFADRVFIEINAQAEAENEEKETDWKGRFSSYGDIVSVKAGKREIFVDWSQASEEENLYQKGRIWQDGAGEWYQFDIGKGKAKWRK